MSLLWKTATEDPGEENWKRVLEEHTHDSRDYISATDSCRHCGRPLLFDPEQESYHAKGRSPNDSSAFDCEVGGQYGHDAGGGDGD